ncbi:polysaccharide pyruvyl transferase family protein [Loktanella agnita]|uniref:polysaccharide pyruvyl transferase family protein n=1 Tax=Loktanella agnita TaxID=287097 RepID=UPI0039868262
MFWSWYIPRNFGDWIGPYLFEKITGKRPVYHDVSSRTQGGCYFTAGSILRRIRFEDDAIVWGSGIMSADDEVLRPRRTLCVRGPLTQQRLQDLGFECPDRFGDPGLLLSRVYPQVSVTATHRLGLIPHFVDLPAFREIDLAAGVKLIDVTQPVEKVASQIASCEVTMSSSLHGLVVSHAYGVPSMWCEPVAAIHGDGSKFRDHFHALRVAPPVAAPNSVWRDHATLRVPDHASAPDIRRCVNDLISTCPFGPIR